MKIGILTQSMAANYGCNLQAYALQNILERFGHDVEIVDRWDKELQHKFSVRTKDYIVRFLKDLAKMCIGRHIYHVIEVDDRPYFWKYILQFQDNHLHKSKKLHSTAELSEYTAQKRFDCYVVGSDQVWRPAYNMNGKLENMFLDFIESQNVKRVAYAASFGVDSWEYSEVKTTICSRLAKKFDAISVREKSAIKLCQDNLGVKASHVLDPTMLLEQSDYNKLIETAQLEKIDGSLFCYILDASTEMKEGMRDLEQKLALKTFTCLPLVPENTYDIFHKADCILPPIERWLQSFRDAEMVLVDSFHGAVFSIIYNKPFWVFGNAKRGLSRFYSLLETFGLSDRLINIDDLQTVDLKRPIDWTRVNNIKRELKNKSLEYLRQSLINENFAD